MNIAYVVPEFVTELMGGGLASYINNIAGILADCGHTVTVFVKSDRDETLLYRPGITVERVYVDLTHVNKEIPGSIYRKWSKILNERLLELHRTKERFDIVQYANWNAFGFYRTEIPTVVRISSDLPLWRAANRIDFEAGKCYECIKTTDYLEELALMKADAVFGPSKILAELIEERTGKKVSVIESPFYQKHIFCDNTVFDKELKGKKYILSHGMLNLLKGTKGIGDSIFAILNENPNLYYAFAGKDCGWEDEEGRHIEAVTYIKKQAGKYADRVVYLGTLSREQLYPVIQHSLFCVLPSRIDNLPNACIEAMAYGKIVVGTRGSSFEQLIEDGVSGFLAQIDNTESLVEKVRRVLQLSTKEKIQLEKNAQERVKEMEPERIGKQVLEFYEATIAGRKSAYKSEYYQIIEEKYERSIQCGNV